MELFFFDPRAPAGDVLSTRDVEDCFKDQAGKPMISRSAVSEITDQLWENYQQFCARDLLEIDVQYLFLDAVYESLRRYGAKKGVLAAWGTCADGRKQLLHLAVGNKESEACWTEFLRNMVGRGHRAPISGHRRRSWTSAARSSGSPPARGRSPARPSARLQSKSL
ncbi:MAG: transposase [Actinomycetota bacterium]